MATRSLKGKKPSSQTGFVRQTIQSNLLEGIIEIPSTLKNCLVELIVLPVGSEKHSGQSKKKAGSPLKRFAGAWGGEQLVREDQGDYEVREQLL